MSILLNIPGEDGKFPETVSVFLEKADDGSVKVMVGRQGHLKKVAWISTSDPPALFLDQEGMRELGFLNG